MHGCHHHGQVCDLRSSTGHELIQRKAMLQITLVPLMERGLLQHIYPKFCWCHQEIFLALVVLVLCTPLYCRH